MTATKWRWPPHAGPRPPRALIGRERRNGATRLAEAPRGPAQRRRGQRQAQSAPALAVANGERRRTGTEGRGGASGARDGSAGQSGRGGGAWPGGAAEPGGSEPGGPGPSGTERNRAGPSGTERDRAETSGNERHRAGTSGTEWNRAGTSGTERDRAAPSGNEWERAGTSGNERHPAGTSGTEWNRAAPSGNERDRAGTSGNERNRAEPSGTERERAAPSGNERHRAEPSGTERNRAGPSGNERHRDRQRPPPPAPGPTGTGQGPGPIGPTDTDWQRNSDHPSPPGPNGSGRGTESDRSGTRTDRSHRCPAATGSGRVWPRPSASATPRGVCHARSRWPRPAMSHAVLLLRRLRDRHRDSDRDSDEERDRDRNRDSDEEQNRDWAQDLDWDRDQHRHREENHDGDRDQDWAQHHDPHPAPRGSLPAPSGAPSAPSPSPRRGRRRRRRPYPAQRIYRVRCSFLELSDEQALRRCRLDRAAIAALCRELGADLQSLTGRSHALPVAVKVTSALAFLASGSFQTASRLSTGISQSAMSNCLAQFLAALQRRAPRYIAFPPPPAPPGDPPALPGVLGLVGAMHVALRAPADNEPMFRNAANFHSINMQVVCDRHGAITNVVAKFPGSCPNAAVLENSALARLMEGSRPEGVWLLGDRTYPLKPWLLTPISGPRGAAELRYNALHARTLDPLRRTLGLLRRRFRCLAGGGLQYSPPKVCQIFLACCILHNIALRRRVPLEPPEGLPPAPGHPEPPPQPPPPPGPGSREGRAVRARVVQQVREGLG